MCNLYSHTKGPKAIRDIVNAMGGDWLDSVGNLELQQGIFPDGVAPVVRATPSGGRELLKMRWGFPSPPQAKSKYTTNELLAAERYASGIRGRARGNADEALAPIRSLLPYAGSKSLSYRRAGCVDVFPVLKNCTIT
ncbi:MAG: hypothetical protein ABJA60_12475 [Nitrosospira sp.]